MQLLRSLLFNILFYINITVWMIAALPTLLLPRGAINAVVRAWSRSNLLLLRVVAGIGWEVRGKENVPPGALLVASKHQSAWETFVLFQLLDDPCFILKRELMRVPLFGWLATKAQMIPVNRGARSRAMKEMNEAAQRELARGRQIIIFPEGTRTHPGAEPAYKFGVAFLYSETNAPCLPVALNSGAHWGRRSLRLQPGTIVVEFLPVIPPGMDRTEFAGLLQERIETATNRLLASGI